eukprot:363870_1
MVISSKIYTKFFIPNYDMVNWLQNLDFDGGSEIILNNNPFNRGSYYTSTIELGDYIITTLVTKNDDTTIWRNQYKYFNDIIGMFMILQQFINNNSRKGRDHWQSWCIENEYDKNIMLFLDKMFRNIKISRQLKYLLTNKNLILNTIKTTKKIYTHKTMIQYHQQKMKKIQIKRDINAIKASAPLLTVAGTPAKLKEICSILKEYNLEVKIPSANVARNIRDNCDKPQLIVENGKYYQYVASVPQHDPTADRISNGFYRNIKNEKFRSMNCFGVYINDVNKNKLKGQSLESIYKQLFQFNSLTNFTKLVSKVGMKVFKLNEKGRFGRILSNNNEQEYLSEIPPNCRVELCFGCNDHSSALHSFGILKEQSKIKQLLDTNVRFQSPLKYIIEMRFNTSNYHQLLGIHITNMTKTEFNCMKNETLEMYIMSDFDTQGHTDPTTPFMLSLVSAKPHDIFIEQRSAGMPAMIFFEKDNYVLNHIDEFVLNMLTAIDQTKDIGSYCRCCGNKTTRFVFDASRFVIKCDRCPLNKVSGVKAGKHKLRFCFNSQTEEHVNIVWIQNETFNFELGDFFDKYKKQLSFEKNKKKSHIDKNKQEFGHTPLYFHLEETIPQIRKVKCAPSIFHASSKGAETCDTMIMYGPIIDTECKEYKELFTSVANWNKKKGTAEGVHGAQETFKVMEKIARKMSAIILPQYYTFHPIVRITTALIRFYDIGIEIGNDTKVLSLLFGSMSFALFSILSDVIGGRKKTFISYLIGAGASNLTDFFLHGIIFSIKYELPPALWTERPDEQALRNLSSLKNDSHRKKPGKKIGQGLISDVLLKPPKKPAKRRLYDTVSSSSFCDAIVHHCMSNNVVGCRSILQFMWTIEKFDVSKEKIHVYSDGMLVTTTKQRDKTFPNHTHAVICICGEKYKNSSLTRVEIDIDDYIQMLQIKLNSICNMQQISLNNKFPGLTDQNNIDFNGLASNKRLNSLTMKQLKLYVYAHELKINDSKTGLINTIQQHITNPIVFNQPASKRRRKR